MFKQLMISASLLMPSMLFAEANITDEDASKTILLTAPGTLSGVVKKKNVKNKKSEEMRFSPESTTVEPPQRYNYPYYNYIRDNTPRFPQYGQVNGRHNPWSEQETNRPLPPALPPALGLSTNPWDLSGNNPIGAQGNKSPSVYNPSQPYSFKHSGGSGMPGFGSMNEFTPNYTDGIFRDTNPAMMGPFFNGFMPGLGGNNKQDFPFAPFNMF